MPGHPTGHPPGTGGTRASSPVDGPRQLFVRFAVRDLAYRVGDKAMHRPNAQEFLQALLETLDDLPPDFAHRFEEVLKQEHVDRAQALRQLFEEFAGD